MARYCSRVGDRVTGWARRHPDAVAVIALTLLPFVIFAHALWPGRVLSPADILMTFPPWASLAPGLLAANPLQSDVAFMFDPWLIYAGRAVASGHFPLWNPYAFAGAPFFANPQTALLFPLTWLAYVLPATLAITLIMVLKLSVAGAWALVRAPATRRPWSFLGAWASGAVIGGALAAVQILPFLEYLGESAVYAYRAQWMPVMAAPPRSALALLMPGYFGSATGRDYWGYFNPNEIAATVGVVPWVALPAAIVGAWRGPGTRFFLGLALVAAVLCYDTPGVTGWLGALAPAGSRAAWLPLAAQVAVLAPTAATENPAIASSLFYPEPPAITHLRARSDPHERVVLGAGKNLGVLYGLREVAGYDGLTPHRVEHLAGPRRESWLLASGSIDVTVDAASPVFDLLAIRRVIVSRGTAALPAHVVADYDSRDARIVTNSRALPRAFLVARARCANDQDALRLIRDAEVDLRHEVVLSGCLTPPPGVAELAVAHVAFTVDEAERMRLTTESDGPAWLVLSDTWFPGWQARVDGVAQPVGRADYAFRAVALGAGRHDVEMNYDARLGR